MKQLYQKYISQSHELTARIQSDKDFETHFFNALDLCVQTLKNGNKILIAGNGGSAADAQHFAAELVGRFSVDRPALAVVALTTDTSILTAIANDEAFERVFARQIEAIGNRGDLFIAISTSGHSKNILSALKAAQQKNMSSLGFTGAAKGEFNKLCKCVINIPSEQTSMIQQGHLMIEHLLCSLIEKSLFPEVC